MNQEEIPRWAPMCFWGSRGLAVLGILLIPLDRLIALTCLAIAWLIELSATAIVVSEDDDE